ncbi:OmpA family protein [Mariniflexile sp.]|uniref:OmpA family protein n=1 Tax=Mariniflexile sp. TaxID=1979402 RepID=UPI003561A8BD
MKLKNHIILGFVLAVSLSALAQSGLQKKADNLFNKFSFVHAAELYNELILKNDNTNYAIRQLADCYAFMRNPDSSVVYYKKVVEQANSPKEYYYKYAQALRGVKNYNESRLWLERFKEAGGEIDEAYFKKDSEFINAIFNTKPHYTLEEVKFNSKYSDFAAYEKDGNVYFASSRDEGLLKNHTYGWNNQPFLDIYIKAENDTLVTSKSKIKGDINSVYHEGPLTISKDGTTLYFSRNDFKKQILGKNGEGLTNLKIYKATLVNGKWEELEEVPFNNTSYSISHPALNNDESKLYFTSDMPGGFGGTDIYYVDIKSDGTYGPPQNLGPTINTNKNESFPFINNEGVLFFSSDGHPGLGLLDIFVAVKDKNDKFINIINLGIPVNSNKDDFSFFMKDDGLSGYFASNRDGGIGSDDIYAYNKIPTLNLQGSVTDANTSKPLVNAIVMLLDSNNKPITKLITDDNGYYEINVDRDMDYYITAKKENYLDKTISTSSKGITKNITSITVNISLKPEENKVIPLTELKPIYFDFDRHEIRQDSTVELDRIVNLMKNVYPNMIIKIESHTDSRGSSPYNDILSEERAKATFDYLIKKGVDTSRITSYKGFGEKKLSNNCDGSISCSEQQHQLNRRTQFIVIKM